MNNLRRPINNRRPISKWSKKAKEEYYKNAPRKLRRTKSVGTARVKMNSRYSFGRAATILFKI